MFWSQPKPWEKTIAVRPRPETWTLFRWMAWFGGLDTALASVTISSRGWNTPLSHRESAAGSCEVAVARLEEGDMNRRFSTLVILALGALAVAAAAAEPPHPIEFLRNDRALLE